MTQEKILTKKIRFPKELFPGEDPNNLPDWIEENDIYYDTATGETIINIKGMSAGSTDTPVYINEQGQPQPITNFSSTLLDKIDEGLDLSDRISQNQTTISENSTFLTILETTAQDGHKNYEVNETLSDFITYNNGVVTISNNFTIDSNGNIKQDNKELGTVYIGGNSQNDVPSNALIWINA